MLQKRYRKIKATREEKKEKEKEEKELEELRNRVFDTDEIKKISQIQNSFKRKFAKKKQSEAPKLTED